MRIGTDVPYEGALGAIGPNVARIAREADAAGIYSLWVADHLFENPNVGRAPELPMLEGYTTLGFIAAQTERIKIGTMVTAAVYRAPGLLGKIATTLDVLSGGRIYMGLGAAWNREEAEGLGIPFPSLGERFERLEEVIQILLQMWASDERPYQGKHYQLARPLNSPNSIQRPHPPLLVAGGGERKTLRLVAQYADACNLIHAPWLGRDLAVVRRKLEVLQEHCARLGRPYGAIEKTAWTQIALADRPAEGRRTPEQAIDELQTFTEMGFDHVVVHDPEVHLPGHVELIGEVARLAGPLVPHGRAAAP